MTLTNGDSWDKAGHTPITAFDSIAEVYDMEYESAEKQIIFQNFIMELMDMDTFVHRLHDIMKADRDVENGLDTDEPQIEPLDEEDDQGAAMCNACNGDAYPLGHLGNLTWFRCRNCGHQFGMDLQ